jgi:predicted nucleic acid-binding protein
MFGVNAKPGLYVETTIPSYLAARPSRDPLIAGQQAATIAWWRLRRKFFELCTSQFVLNEAALGEARIAAKRLQILRPIERLHVTPEVDDFARRVLTTRLLPAKAAVDAFHIATATVHGVHFLLTWNCAHINNGEIIPGIERLATAEGYALPVICTPLELMGISEP